MPDGWYYKGSAKPPVHSCGIHKDTRDNPGHGLVLEPYFNNKMDRCWGNGILMFAPDFSNGALLKSFLSAENVNHAGKALAPAEAGKPAAVVVRLASPYIMVKARGEAAGADKVEVSVDGGKTFKAVELGNFDQAVKGNLAALVRISFKRPLTALKLEAIVQNNPCALPYLSPGKNAVTVSVADPGALGNNRLVVTYAYRLGARALSFEQLIQQGKRIADQSGASWSDMVTCVQKSFTAKDLPATFEIDCPTPKGQYPVYPRMMFLRREVLALRVRLCRCPRAPWKPRWGRTTSWRLCPVRSWSEQNRPRPPGHQDRPKNKYRIRMSLTPRMLTGRCLTEN